MGGTMGGRSMALVGAGVRSVLAIICVLMLFQRTAEACKIAKHFVPVGGKASDTILAGHLVTLKVTGAPGTTLADPSDINFGPAVDTKTICDPSTGLPKGDCKNLWATNYPASHSGNRVGSVVWIPTTHHKVDKHVSVPFRFADQKKKICKATAAFTVQPLKKTSASLPKCKIVKVTGVKRNGGYFGKELNATSGTLTFKVQGRAVNDGKKQPLYFYGAFARQARFIKFKPEQDINLPLKVKVLSKKQGQKNGKADVVVQVKVRSTFFNNGPNCRPLPKEECATANHGRKLAARNEQSSSNDFGALSGRAAARKLMEPPCECSCAGEARVSLAFIFRDKNYAACIVDSEPICVLQGRGPIFG